MKIFLINPPARSVQRESIIVPPLGLMYIGAKLKKAGFNVKIKDAFAERMNWQDFTDYIKKARPDIMGIGGMSPVVDTSFRAIKIARPYTRHIIMGGPHISLYKQKIFHMCPEIDFGVIGEGEETTLELIRALDHGKSIDGITGVVTADIQNKKRELIRDIDTIPFPDRDMVPYRLYRYPLLKDRYVTTMFTSRGCPYHCTFCDKSTFGSIWRPRSVENVLSEIDEIVNYDHIKSIIFYDDLFTLNKERVMALCEGILKQGYRFDWKCEGRVNLVDLEMLKLMKRAGCSINAYGVESGNQIGLDYLNKKTETEDIRRAFFLTRQAGIRTIAYFILGIPVESYRDEMNTIEFAKEIKPTYAQFSILSPYYGTRVYDDAVERGWYREIDAQNPTDKDFKRPVIISENWDIDRLQSILKTAHHRFYFRSRYIVRMILSIRSIHQLLSHFREFFTIIFWMKSR